MGIHIKKIEVFCASDGKTYGTFKEAAEAERRYVIEQVLEDDQIYWREPNLNDVIDVLIANADKVIEALQAKPSVIVEQMEITSSEFTVKTSAKPKKTDASSQELDREFDDMPLSDTLNGIFTQVPTRTGDDIEELDLA